MPYHADWYRPYRVIDARISGRLSVEELDFHVATCERMLRDALREAPDNTVHLLFDTTGAESIPLMYMMPKRGVHVLGFKNRGILFLVVQNPAIRSVMEITIHLSRAHFPARVFKDRQAALDALELHLDNEDMSVPRRSEQDTKHVSTESGAVRDTSRSAVSEGA